MEIKFCWVEKCTVSEGTESPVSRRQQLNFIGGKNISKKIVHKLLVNYF